MSAQTALPKDHPIMRAWEAYQATKEYANTERWARVEEHTKGSLWAAFIAGYNSGVIKFEKMERRY